MKSRLSGLLLSFLCYASLLAQTNYVSMVNPFIGTGGHGHTFPGPVVPFGMVQVGPDTRVDGSWDGCSGYHYSDTMIYGFSHTHLSGTGCSDYGDVMLMPVITDNLVKGADMSYLNPVNYRTAFSHRNEKASAGYYQVKLNNQIGIELTTTTRVGMHRYSFPKTNNASLVLDLTHRDELLDGTIEVIDEQTIRGYRRSKAWAKDQHIFFYMKFSEKMKFFSNGSEGKYVNGNKLAKGKDVKALLTFVSNGKKPLLVKVAISGVDMEGAQKNMEAELPGWDFEKVRSDAEALWNKELGKIEVSGGNSEQRITFYTALYHCFIHPSIYNDVDGRYMGRDFKIHKADGFSYYTVFSLWDTFRALHPLFNLVQRERNRDFILTFLEQYKQAGRMPMWELSSNETDCMIGYHSLSVIADAISQYNLPDKADRKLLLEAAEKTSHFNHYGVPVFHDKGYLSTEDEHESVSKTLEYAYGDWCLNRIKLGLAYAEKDTVKVKELEASENLSWQNVFNPKTGFMQPRKNGGWHQPFDPREVNNNYTEANAWQYSFFVPQNIPGLITAMGGPEAFEKKLDALFTENSATTGRQQADISGLIGQYAHGNEPSHHMAYLYNFVGKPHKTQERVQQIMREMYRNAPDGLAGNEDCGQMSAWYVFSAMGFYPVTPGKMEYQLGSSLFDKVKVKSENNEYTFEWKRTEPGDIYFRPELAQNGPILMFSVFRAVPNTSVTLSQTYIGSSTPFSDTKEYNYTSTLLPSPIIQAAGKTFYDSLQVNLYPNFPNKDATIWYTITKGDQTTALTKFNKPFYIHESCRIDAITRWPSGKDMPELKATGNYHRIPHHWSVKLNSKYNPQYTGGGDEAVIDGLTGEADWRKGGWQGYAGVDFEAVLDLKKEQDVKEIFAGFLNDQRAWIMLPQLMECYVSTDGINYQSVGLKDHAADVQQLEPFTYNLTLKLPHAVKARYVKVVARNYGLLPDWHLSKGEKAWLFVDEIGVR